MLKLTRLIIVIIVPLFALALLTFSSSTTRFIQPNPSGPFARPFQLAQITQRAQSLQLIKSAQAQLSDAQKFYTKLTTIYEVDQSAKTKVKHQFTIKNLTPTAFIKQYSLALAYPDLEELKVYDGKNAIDFTTEKTNYQTTINITFDNDAVGEGKVRTFTIEYTNTDLATIGGNSLEVHAPGLSDPEQYNEHEVKIITPLKYGNALRANHEIASRDIAENGIATNFKNLSGDALSVLYGDSQLYDMTLRFNLDNTGGEVALMQLALPPDTSFQKMYYRSLDPFPQDIKRDADGNWIAQYLVPANSGLSIYLTALVNVTIEPRSDFIDAQPTSNLTKKDDFWETNTQRIKEEANNYRTPKEIYDFVVQALSYDTSLDQTNHARFGAKKALDKPEQALAEEFTDVFVALARANDIPARRVIGYAFSKNNQLRPTNFAGDILHVWPEYYDSKLNHWVPVDPTWGNTTGGVDYFDQFDLNHVVFAINGNSSSLPYPAGTYKSSGVESQDIEIGLSEEKLPQSNPSFEVEIQPIKILKFNLPGFYNLILKNKTGEAWYDTSIDFEYNPDIAKINKGKSLQIPAILPFQTYSLEMIANTRGMKVIDNFAVNISLKSKESNTDNAEEQKIIYEKQENNLSAGPSFIGYIKDTKILVFLGVGLTIFILIGGSVLVFRRT